MGYSVTVHDRAREDYREIVECLLLMSDGPAAAERFVSEFDRQVALISDNPALYAPSRIAALADLGYRAALVNSYIVMYYVSQDVVHIAHIFHQSQDYARYVVR